jgi:hypothetical protein
MQILTGEGLIFSFYSPIVLPMRALPFPKSCVVCCKKCGHDVLAGTDGFPANSIFVVCSLCGEKRKYLPSEVIHGRPHCLVRRKRAPRILTDTRRGPLPAQFGSLRGQRMAAGGGR